MNWYQKISRQGPIKRKQCALAPVNNMICFTNISAFSSVLDYLSWMLIFLNCLTTSLGMYNPKKPVFNLNNFGQKFDKLFDVSVADFTIFTQTRIKACCSNLSVVVKIADPFQLEKVYWQTDPISREPNNISCMHISIKWYIHSIDRSGIFQFCFILEQYMLWLR